MPATTRDEDMDAIGLLHEPVRRRLYDWVVAQPEPVGREAAASAVGIKRALAAFHLDRLAEAGLLETGYRRLTGRSGPGAGRPARVYSRARREVSLSLPARHYERAAELFATALERIDATTPPAALHDAAIDLGEELGHSTASDGDARQRLLSALAANGYEPVAEADGVIRLRNCPFDALVDEHRPLVCGTNLALAEGIAHGAGADDYRAVAEQRPGFCCVAYSKEPGAS